MDDERAILADNRLAIGIRRDRTHPGVETIDERDDCIVSTFQVTAGGIAVAAGARNYVTFRDGRTVFGNTVGIIVCDGCVIHDVDAQRVRCSVAIVVSDFDVELFERSQIGVVIDIVVERVAVAQ